MRLGRLAFAIDELGDPCVERWLRNVHAV